MSVEKYKIGVRSQDLRTKAWSYVRKIAVRSRAEVRGYWSRDRVRPLRTCQGSLVRTYEMMRDD